MKSHARLRTLIEIPGSDSNKERFLEIGKQKVEILKGIDSKLEVIAGNVTYNTGLMVSKLEMLISNWNKLINMMSSRISSRNAEILLDINQPIALFASVNSSTTGIPTTTTSIFSNSTLILSEAEKRLIMYIQYVYYLSRSKVTQNCQYQICSERLSIFETNHS